MGKKFAEYSKFDLSEINKEVLKKWDENQVFAKSMTEREGCPSFVFFEGPPSANGMPGIHHVMARSIKDIFCRYKTMKGFQVKRKAGWDTHGLPWCDGRCVQDPGTYSPRHSDPRLLAIPASCSRVADYNPNWDVIFGICSHSHVRFPLFTPL